jgi:hypothetical protein
MIEISAGMAGTQVEVQTNIGMRNAIICSNFWI